MAKLLGALKVKAILVTEPYEKARLKEKLCFYIKQNNSITRAISGKCNLLLVDLDKEMSGKKEYFIEDGIHMTDLGASMKAISISSAMLKSKRFF